jgi:hypothetical protein
MKTDILFDALGTKRGHGSQGEAEFIARLCQELPPTRIDGAGNLHYDMTGGTSRTLFTAHTDTVTRDTGTINHFTVDDKGIIHASGDVLGADDGAGIAILFEMMRANVPGFFILFRGEERGGIGSRWLAANEPELLRKFDRAVAFDRRGTTDVITHQGWSRCCSDVFAEALSTALCDQGLLYMPCDGGIYTDTAEFVTLVPECTNLAVGYFSEHSDKETLDLPYLEALVESCIEIDWESLPTARDPSEDDKQEHIGWPSWAQADSLDELGDALDAWEDGDDSPLKELIAIELLPDDPGMAMHCVDMSRMTQDLCDEVWNHGSVEPLLDHLVVFS